MKIIEQVDARKLKYGADEALELARAANELWVAKGKNVQHFNLKKDKLPDEELSKLMTGPTGSLRAPTIRRGKKLFVGFHAETYESELFA